MNSESATATKSKTKRCEFPECKRKLDLTAFPCRCEKFFCANHRLSEQHCCKYDYFKNNQELLRKNMSSAIVCAKVEKL